MIYKIILISVSLLLTACQGKNADPDKTPESIPGPENKQSNPILSGIVDSSLIDRNAQNRVYVYSGKLNDPIATALAVQTPGTCQWTYEIQQLPTGAYTLVFAKQPQQFIQKQQILIQDSPLVINFTATHVITVGSDHTIKTPSAAAQIANPGDVIEIDVGNYSDDTAVWRDDNITIRGIMSGTNVRPHIQMTKPISYIEANDQANGMGIWVLKADNISVENMEFSGAKVAHKNGAGIRIDNASNTTICNSYFHDNENGLLGGGGTLLIEYSEFKHNGSGTGYTHNIYVNKPETILYFQYNYTHGAEVGHNLKTRAKVNYILYNRIMDEKEGRSSYLVDVSNGGLTYMIGNVMQQGYNTVNKTAAITYGLERIIAGNSSRLYFANNTLVNNLVNSYFLKLSERAQASLYNNLFIGAGTVANRQVTSSNNLKSDTLEVVEAGAYNYHLRPNSKAIDAGKTIEHGENLSLMPKFEYVNTASKKSRVIKGAAIDIGAYEYDPINEKPDNIHR